MNLFQSPEWEQFKLATGYQKSYRVDGVLVLQKNLPLGRSMLYSPMVNQSQISKLKTQNYISKLKAIGQENKTIFYRAEFDSQLTDPLINELNSSGFIKSFEEMQPEHTLILDITKSNEELLAQMKPKGRYNIKVAEKHGVVVKKTRDVSNFYSLYEQTAKRQRITYRSLDYFQKLLDNLEPKGYAELFVAITTLKDNAELTLNMDPRVKPEDDRTAVLAAAIISFYKNRATYLFGASSDEMRNVMAPYGLHWQIIAEAKRRGCTEYDFFGISPDDNPKHAWAGVTSFKKKFGGEEVHLLGSFDLILRPTEYQIFKVVEKMRRH